VGKRCAKKPHGRFIRTQQETPESLAQGMNASRILAPLFCCFFDRDINSPVLLCRSESTSPLLYWLVNDLNTSPTSQGCLIQVEISVNVWSIHEYHDRYNEIGYSTRAYRSKPLSL